jgi:predicted O-methyltransferase YrrM
MFYSNTVIDHIRGVEGWRSDAEAELLIVTAAELAERAAEGRGVNIVEVGSYCGKSTIALGLALKNLCADAARVYAVDPHEGEVTGLDQGVMRLSPTFDRFNLNVREAGVADLIEPIKARSCEVEWDKPIDLLFIDGCTTTRTSQRISDTSRPGCARAGASPSTTTQATFSESNGL